MDKLYNHRIINTDQSFDDNFMEIKRFYLNYTGQHPNINFVNSIDSEKASVMLSKELENEIADVFERRWYDKKKRKYQFDKMIIVLKENVIVEMGRCFAEIAHDGNHNELLQKITSIMLRFKKRERREPLEINLIVKDEPGLDLKPMEIKKTKLDLDLFYEDDFKETDAIIQSRLMKKDDKGIVLLHGLPGTGKTTYLRYLVGKIKKRVLFLSPSVAGNLMNPDFMDLLIDNPNSVLIIEDAENIITDRRFSGDSSVSNLLNISDGLLADFLNVQLICTFNIELSQVDSALLRKGRLIARYEFGKLGINKSQRLSEHFGYTRLINEPMTIAEIANPNDKAEPVIQRNTIGFKRTETLMN